MPNWVYNTVTITGSPELVEQVREKLAQPYTTYHHDFVKNEETGEFERKPVEWVHDQAFSFWNIDSPTDLDAYYGEETVKIDMENFAETYTKAMKIGMDWYHWNAREWGCKWDAKEVDVQEDFIHDGKLSIGYKFDTPWSPPLPAIEKLALQYPDLIINIEFEEEQGWGGDLTLQGENVLHDESWDIPDSHEENIYRRSYCHACESVWYDEKAGEWDKSGLYDDCPEPDQEQLDKWLADLTAAKENGNVVP